MFKLRNKLVVICVLHLLFFGVYVVLKPNVQNSNFLQRISSYSLSNGSQLEKVHWADDAVDPEKERERESPPRRKLADDIERENVDETKKVEQAEKEDEVPVDVAVEKGTKEILQPRIENTNEDVNTKVENENVIDITPANFVEIKKTVPKKSKGKQGRGEPVPEWLKHTKSLTKNTSMKPKVLKERYEKIKISGENPGLVAFVEEQERRRANVEEECRRVEDSPSKGGRGDNKGPPVHLSSRREIILDRGASLSNLSSLPQPQQSPLAAEAHTQQHRDDRLRSMIRNIKRGASSLLFGAYQHLIVDTKHFLSFCPVFKAASTSWSISLLLLNEAWNENKTMELQPVIRQVFPKISNLAGPMMTEGTTRFIVVRHPFERLVSCYRDKFEDAKKDFYYRRYGETMVRRFRTLPSSISTSQGRTLLRQVKDYVNNPRTKDLIALRDNPYANPLGPTFIEFVKYVVTVRVDDEHWRPYNLHCSLCYINYDFILRFENMYDESHHFITYINQTEKIKPRWDNPTKDGATNIDVSSQYFKQLPSYLIKLLIEKYRIDFDLFEYSYDEHLRLASDYESLS
ncbi:carbohydrate sulfotransferase 11-like isoform X2 [Oratosquilla oratoria]